MEAKYKLSDYDFDLPEELIAQFPADRRENSRLFVLDKPNNCYHHKSFKEIGDFLKPNDVLVINNTKVLPARMYFKRESGAKIEVVLARKTAKGTWLVITNRTKRLKEGEVISNCTNEEVKMTIGPRINEYLEVTTSCELSEEILSEIGQVPLPPYIKRNFNNNDRERYQTVYAKNEGAVAAPTAGLHFTPEIIEKLKEKGIKFVEVTLHVSWGTFRPVRVDDIREHEMHYEYYVMSEDSAKILNNARQQGSRIIAVGTTSLRVLESVYQNNEYQAGTGETNIFIYPPYKIKSIDAMITNFHTPESTLLMLVSALVGYDEIMNAYKTAVEEKYRFFSYGDSMLILR